MSQCVVPNWELEDPPPNPTPNPPALRHPFAPILPLANGSNDEVAELTWRNGQLGLQGHTKWRNHAGTLESVVHQATSKQFFPATPPAPDALVPCREPAEVTVPNATAGRKQGVAVGVCSSQGSAPPPVPRRRVRAESIIEHSIDTSGVGATTTNTNTNSDVPNYNMASGSYENGSRDEHKGKGSVRNSQRTSSCNKSRAAITHSQSERKRRDRINQKMTTLQKLVPNSSKTDKASILDEVIEYMKQLQAQVQMMNRMSSMMMPMPMPMPQLQMSMMANMAQMAQMTQMGMSMVDMTSVNRPKPSTVPPLLHPSAFLPLTNSGAWDNFGDRSQQNGGLSDPYSAFLAYQKAQQPMNLDAFNRTAALFQQLYQQKPPANP